MSTGFQAPAKGTEEYDAWLDGPRPEAGNGRGQWLRARQLRAQGLKAADGTGKAAKGDAQRRMAAGSGQPAPPIPTADAATRSVLVAIRDDASAHDSDRIRAAQALIALDREAEAQATGVSPLVALAQTLSLLRPEERLAWLQGERIAHVGAEQSGVGDAQSG